MSYFVYILKCKDGTYYTGITTDLVRRTDEHNLSNRGANYTKSRRPCILSYYEEVTTRSIALKREHAIRQLSRTQKSELFRLN